MAMEDLLKALLGGSAGQASGDASAEDPMAAMFGNASAGEAAQDAGDAEAPADLGGLLNALMGAGASQGAGTASGGSADVSGLLGALLGGGAQQDAGTAPGGSADMSGLLGALLGGGAQQDASTSPLDAATSGTSGGMSGGLESLLGAGAGGSQSSAGVIGQLLAPFIESLVEKIGLPQEIAQVVVTFALNKLLGGLTGGAPGGGGGSMASGAQQAQASGLDGLLAQLSSGQGVDTSYLRSSGLAEELASQTGLDQKTAARSLQAVFGMLGDQMSGGGQA